MATWQPSVSVIRFAPFELDLRKQELRRNGWKVDPQPQPQAFRLVRLLASHPNELITREQIRAVLWPEEVHTELEVLDRRLNFAIRELREVLGDDAQSPQFVETVRKSGYRFVAPVQCVEWPGAGRPEDKAPDNALVTNHGNALTEAAAGAASKRAPSHFTRPDLPSLVLGAVLGAAAMVGGLVAWRLAVNALFRPVITSVSPIEAKRDQQIVIQGHGFGYHYTPLKGLNTAFLAIGDETAHWSAGRTVPQNADDVTLNITTWTDYEIVIEGFSGAYGQNWWALEPGDTIKLLLWNPQTGAGPAIYYAKVSPARDPSPRPKP